ncbi:MAG: hypothetical protein KDI45_17055 [Candidatus Accumulibacter sp.]|nr:hypothetical protein [Accumulibacter sp.]MCB1967753.1 hypothetical protein [Accumulibacter sp.]
MKTPSTLTATLIGASLLATWPLAAMAREPVIVETIVQEPVVVEAVLVSTYLNGGVGKDEAATMRRLAKEFPLRMTFSERKDGEFIADVPVVILDASGNPVFELPKAGPMLYVMLPHGNYRVIARFKGLTESQNVTLTGKEGKDLYFHWKK